MKFNDSLKPSGEGCEWVEKASYCIQEFEYNAYRRYYRMTGVHEVQLRCFKSCVLYAFMTAQKNTFTATMIPSMGQV